MYLLTQALITVVLAGNLLSCVRPQESAEARFWRWFVKDEARLFDFEKDQERIFNELQTEMHRVNPDLTFEFGPKTDGKREFVISADGISASFPAVIALADAAPSLPRWKVTKFRPRRGFQSRVRLNGVQVGPEQVQFTIEPDGPKAGITLFLEGYDPKDREKYMGVLFLLLDESLGEYDVETKMGFIEVKASSTPSKLVKHPFSTLTEVFDQFFRKNGQK